jgi:hypothetical protein
MCTSKELWLYGHMIRIVLVVVESGEYKHSSWYGEA